MHACMHVSRSVIPDSLRPHGLQPTRLLCPWDFPGKDTGVGCHFLLQGIFPTQGSNLGLLHCRQILYQLSYTHTHIYIWASLVAQLVKNLQICLQCRRPWGFLSWEDPLEKGTATHSSILAWKIPWTVQSMGSQRVRHNWATFIFTFTLLYIKQISNKYSIRNPTQYFVISYKGK